jgi:hypothetical protein
LVSLPLNLLCRHFERLRRFARPSSVCEGCERVAEAGGADCKAITRFVLYDWKREEGAGFGSLAEKRAEALSEALSEVGTPGSLHKNL